MDLKQQQSVISGLYILLIISTVLSFVPIGLWQIVSLALILLALVIAYYYKAQKNEDSFMWNHSVYLIRTIWIGGSVLFFGMIAASILVLLFGDHSLIENSMEQITSGGMMDEDGFTSLLYDYMEANKSVLVMASIPTIAPSILYFVYRIVNGYGRAIKGYRLANPNSWL